MKLDVMRIDVPEAVMNLGEQLQDPMDDLLDVSAHYIAGAYRSYIVKEGAVESGEFLRSVHVEGDFRLAGDRHKQVVADVGYSAVIEYGWISRGAGQASYPGRYPAQQAIQFYINNFVANEIRSGLGGSFGRAF